MSIKEPTQSIWNRFWEHKNNMDKVYPSSPSVFKTIEKHFNLEGLKVLEVGAGTGRDSIELARRGAEVYVLDFAENSLKIVEAQKFRHQLIDNVHLVRGDAFVSPFLDNSFDLVFHQGLLEHFLNPLNLLKENYRILRKGGHCLCDVPQTVHIYTLIKHLLIKMDKWFAGWETQYTMPQLKAMMEKSGFHIQYSYGDWKRPNLIYRMLRELCFRLNIELPKYPLSGTWYQKTKDQILDALETVPFLHYTQLSIGVLGKK